jgi:acyl-CoA dehydrogenase
VRTTERAVQVCGGWGYIRDLPVEKWYRDAKLYTIFEGTSEIQRVVIGRTLAEAAPKGPTHFTFPDDKGGLSRTFGRGSPARGRAGMTLLKVARSMPESLLALPGKVAAPPGKN